MCAFPQCGFETVGQRKGRERKKARKHRKGFDLQSRKENRNLFSCQWKLGGLEMPKGWFTLMRKAIAQQQEEMQGGC